MPKYIFIVALLAISSLLGACSTLQFPGVYKITVEQGNVITQEIVDQLKPGMSKDQVEYIMGSPLIKDSFNAKRWDYIYNIRRGDELHKEQRMTIFFKADRLDYFTGDFVPTAITEQAQQSAEKEG
ncbi:MAG: outer membrane protein assembly factor BamE [Oceanicoccus sp.]|uniref:outer membrane protein assembly factor BamE n=1 Tax=Oceanicoccus sp. TaxID=2691044 RepID=UPI0026049A26|nr:outer membrane protein assembly factor BamE [Oceanicoccus sp.]MCP3908132.1 outer membrane protein assembly factor BamE [Oceanicoccus sp.]